jgi:hypothetical protein
MESAFRRGVRVWVLAMVAGVVPGVAGFVVANLLGWSTVAQAAIFGVGFYAFLMILFLLDVFERQSITRPVWTLWAIALVGIFAGVGCFVAADKTTGSGGQLALRIFGVVLAGFASLVPITLRVAADRRAAAADRAVDSALLKA